jgi:hypothetical protein
MWDTRTYPARDAGPANHKGHLLFYKTVYWRIDMDGLIQLPGGFQVGEDGFAREVEFREMTGLEEEILIDQRRSDGGKGKSLKSMSDRLTEILSRCTVRIGDKLCEDNKDPAKASQKPFWEQWSNSYLGDRTVSIVRLRQLSLGDIFAFRETCPACRKEIQRVEYDLNDVQVDPYFKWIERDLEEQGLEGEELAEAAEARRVELFNQDEYEITLPKSRSVLKYRLLRRKDEDRIQTIAEKHSDSLMTALLSARLTAIDGSPITSLRDVRIKRLTLSDRDFLRTHFDEAEGGMDTQVIISCDSCNHQFQRKLDPSKPGFFHRLGA